MRPPYLEIEDPSGQRRAELVGALHLAADGGDLPLPAAGPGLLRLTPGNAEWLPTSSAGGADAAPPRINGTPWSGPRRLAEGDRIEWGAVRLVYHTGAAPAPGTGKAQLEELEIESLPAAAAPGVRRTARERAWRRVWSGLLVEQQLVASTAARAVQEEVRRGEFDADEAADRVLEAERKAEADQRVLDRTRALQRDLVMAPLNTDAHRAVRKVRNRASSGLAYLTAQFITLGVYSLLILIGLVLLRHRGLDLDGFLDGILGIFGGGAD